MFDHVALVVSDPVRSAAGHADLEGIGDDHEVYLFFKKGKPHPKTVHFAFRAKTQKAVAAFYKAAIAAGGRDNGAPGPRPQYFPGYYAAYVLDPDGYNVEAVHQS